MPGEYATDSPSFIEKLGANTDTYIQRFFQYWGWFCAEKPWLILFLGACAVVGLGHGIKYLHITTDPVELWASPNSRSRVERDFFDKSFQPFYRNEQIIIKAVNLPDVVFNTTDGLMTFGPVFNAEFLKAVLELQEGVKKIGQGTDWGLDKICFAPLRNEGEEENNNVEQCVVQSIWAYYQNDESVLDDEGDYLDKFTQCTQ